LRPHLRIAIQLLVSGALIAYLLWRINLDKVASLVAHADLFPLLLTLVVFVALTWGLAWRWQLLLEAKRIHEALGWLTRMYFVGQAASQVLPTGIGGDAVRILEHSRRRPNAKADVAAAVLVERATGAAATFALVAIGLVLAATLHERVREFVWIEAGLVSAAVAGGYLLFSLRARRQLARLVPAARTVRLDAIGRSLYLALHGYRDHVPTLLAVTGISFVLQVARVLGIWLCGESVGVHLSPVPYLILGPLLFLVMLVPFTINGIGLRETFFVAFLSHWNVGASHAFTTGFLYFAITIASTLPGAILLLSSRFQRTVPAA
jgi:uncharacterized protein (TIRG00374 family)